MSSGAAPVQCSLGCRPVRAVRLRVCTYECVAIASGCVEPRSCLCSSQCPSRGGGAAVVHVHEGVHLHNLLISNNNDKCFVLNIMMRDPYY